MGETDKYTNCVYPSKPSEPLDSDCCGSGCSTCVFDLYELELKRWKQRCEEIDLHIPISGDNDILSIYDFRLFKLIDVLMMSSSMIIFTFEIPANGKLPIHCGQHIIAKSYIDEKAIIRPYTPISKRSDRGFFKIAAKIYGGGKMSECMKTWKIGDEIEWRGPFGEFIYKANEYDFLLLLAGGTGVTPMIQVMGEILDNEEDYTKIKLFYSVQHSSDILLKEVLIEWNSYWNCDICYCLTGDNPGKENMRYGDSVHYGRIDSSCLNYFVPEPLPGSYKVLICGSRIFNEDMKNLIMNLYGNTEEQIFCFS